MSRVLERLLESRHPDVEFEVINAAVTAINSHVVYQLAQDCVDLDADLWLVYMGNNEVNGPFGSGSVFGSRRPGLGTIRTSLAYQKTKLGQWMAGLGGGREEGVPKSWGGMKMFLKQQVSSTDPDLARVYGNFQSNVADLIQLAKDTKVPLLLSSVPVNLEDFGHRFSR